MQKVSIIGFEDWKIYEGFAEGSGRGEKIWLCSDTGEIGLFKFPKIDPAAMSITTEYISEHMAYQIGQIIGVETARVDIGVRNQRIGCMSYLLNKPEETIAEGALFITGNHPDYDTELMIETGSGMHYCLEHLFQACENAEERYKMIQMMLFDFLIGNSDRHQNNWAMLVGYSDQYKQCMTRRFCPLYDNGSSLCSYVTAAQAKELIGNDRTRFEATVDTKSRSMIRIHGSDKKRPTHREMVAYLLDTYPETRNIAVFITDKLSQVLIDDIVDMYTEVLESEKIELLKRFLNRKIEILKELCNKRGEG